VLEIFGSELVISEAVKQGLWAVLYIALFIHTLRESKRQQDIAKEREDRLREEYQELRKENREREAKLTNFINEITKQYERIAKAVEKLTIDVDEIKDELKIRRKGGDK